jgi:hypothetical protein
MFIIYLINCFKSKIKDQNKDQDQDIHSLSSFVLNTNSFSLQISDESNIQNDHHYKKDSFIKTI